MQLGAILADKVLQVCGSLVDVAHSLENSVLTDIFGGEFVPTAYFRGQWHSIVHVIDILLGPVAHVTDEPVKVVALGHCNRAISVVLLDLVHQQKGHILVVDVQDEVRSALEDPSGQLHIHHLKVGQIKLDYCSNIGQFEINYTYILEYIISLAHVALIDQVQWVPPEVHGLMGSLGLPVGVELLVLHQVDVKVDSGLETLLLHPVATVAMKTDCVVAYTAQILNNLRSDKVGLPGVGQQADRLHVTCCEAALRQVLIQHISFLIINS